MAYALVGTPAHNSTSSTVTTLSVTYSPTAGNGLILIYSYQFSNAITVSSIQNQSSTTLTYTLVASQYDGANEGGVQAFWIPNVPSGITAIKINTSSGAGIGIEVLEYSGLWTTNSAAGTASNEVTATLATDNLSLSVTPTQQPGMLFSVAQNLTNNTGTLNAGTGFTGRTSTTYSLTFGSQLARTEDKRITSTSATNATFTNTATSGDSLQILGFVIPEAATAPVLSSPTSSNVLATTATVGATTDTGSGTLYAVVYTGTTPTATQIKAGQNSSGAATANANVAVSSTGAKTLNITGLTASTAYNYALVQNSGSDSNIVTGTFTTSAPTAAVLSSPTSSAIQTTTATAGATTDTGAGTLYVVAYSSGTTPTATQIKAGQDSSGAATPNANVAVSSSGAKTVNLTGLTAATAYTYALIQNNGSDSNIVTGTFTTLAVPVLSSPTSSSVTTTTATVGATTTVGAGTLYAVAYTGAQPTATQIKAGQNSSGATTPSGTVAVSSTGAKTINLTGLSTGTAYNYALVQNDGSDSNVATGTFTTLIPAATLSSPTSSSVVDVSATIGATTDTGSGTIYGVIYTGSVPTATQIKAGQNFSGAATPSNNAAVASTGAKTLAITGLTQLTAYNYALVQNVTGGDSNVVTGTLTTTATPVTISSTSSANPAVGSTMTITGTGFGASQGTGTVVIGGTTQTVTSWSATSIAVTVSAGINLYGSAVNLVVTNGVGTASSNYSLTGGFGPQSGWSYVTVGTPFSPSSGRLTSTPDIVSTDQITWDNKSATVVVNTDGTFSSTVSQTFNFAVGVSGVGFGTQALQSVVAVGGVIAGFHGALASSVASLNGVTLSVVAAKHGVTR